MKKESVNTFDKGLNLDLHPTVTPNSVLTDNLNGTFITYNGNEFCLQNDKGNFEVAHLSEGYVPIGAKEYNGIIYIVSVKNKLNENDEIIPWESETEIGTYPGVDWSVAYEEKHDLLLPEKVDANVNCYTPLQNIDVVETDTGVTRGSFSGLKLGYTTQTPITIEIQPSYDGSVNLILTDGVNPVRMINSGFSILEQDQYKLISRHQDIKTNEYSSDDKKITNFELIRNSTTITNVDLKSVAQGGQLKGGNYTFYIKFGDGDYNQTDVVAESGIVSIFKGTDGDPRSIYGTLLDERTDKLINLTITGINPIFSKIYVYYTREYSDTLGYRLTEAAVLKEPFKIETNSTSQTIVITGFEQTEVINIEELNIDYHTFDNARAMAQQQSMLFLGNLKQNDTYKLYDELRNQSLSITPKEKQTSLDATSTKFSGGEEYYSTKNIYNYIGYWPDEYYRFGIVYILEDGSTTPVFNVKGNVNDGSSIGNNYGIIKTSRLSVLGSEQVKPIYFEFDLSHLELDSRVKGYFIVRQKRIPTTICQGLSIGIDQRTHLPITWNGANWITESFLSVNRDVAYESYTEDGEHPYIPRSGSRNVVWAKLSHNHYFTYNYDPKLEVQYNHTAVYKDASIVNKPTYLWNQVYSTKINWYEVINPETGEPYLSFQDWRDDIAQEALDEDGQTLMYYVGSNVNRDTMSTGFSVWETRYRIKYKYNSSSDSYNLFLPEIGDSNPDTKDIVFITENQPLTNDIIRFSGAVWWNTEDYIPVTFIDTKSPSDYDVTYELSGGYEDKNKFIVYGHTPTGGSYVEKQKKGSGLLSLDPAVIPSVRNVLDGSEFTVRREYNVITHYGPKKDSYYADTNRNSGSYLLLTEDIFGDSTDIGEKSRCAYIPPNTNIKVIDNYAFSNVAGNKADVTAVAYTSEQLAIDCDKDKDGSNIFSPYYWCGPVTDAPMDQYESGDHDGTTESDSTLIGFNSNQNINVVRGIFTPYIGIASDNVSDTKKDMGIYSIRLNDINDSDQLIIRSQDNSPYYTVSKRMPINTNVSVYRGDCFTCTVGMRIITNFVDDNAPTAELIVQPQTWKKIVANQRFDSERINSDWFKAIPEVNISDINNANLGYWVTFKCLSSYNLGLRAFDYSHEEEQSLLGSPRSFFPVNGGSTASGNKMPESLILNDGYSATVGEKRFNLFPDIPYQTSEFANRIIFSNVQVENAFTNGYRVFQGLSFKDYDKQYGEIVKLIPWDNNLLVVMEHGIGLVGVNEKALMQTNTADTIHIYGHGVLSDQMQIVSPDFGSKYEHSVIRTPIGVYGIDTDARKIWRVTTRKGFETLSDMKIESYLNDEMGTNMSVQLELCDVRTHYNTTKGDIMFTFYKTKSKIKPNKTVIPTEKEYFTISTSRIKMSMGETISIPFSTNLPIDKISITETTFVSAELDCDNKVIKITAPNNSGTGNVVVNNNLIVVEVKSIIDEYIEEQQEITEATGTTTKTEINEETGEEETVVIPITKIEVKDAPIESLVGDNRIIEVYFNKEKNATKLSESKIEVIGITATWKRNGEVIVVTPTTTGTGKVRVTYNGVSAESRVFTVVDRTMYLSENEVSVIKGFTKFVACVDYVGDVSVSSDNEDIASVTFNPASDRLVIIGLKSGTGSFTISDSKTSLTLSVNVPEDIPINTIEFYDSNTGQQITLPRSITLHVGETYTVDYKCIPTNYTPETGGVGATIHTSSINAGAVKYTWNEPAVIIENGNSFTLTAIRPTKYRDGRVASVNFQITVVHFNSETVNRDIISEITIDVTVIE